jgi:hypothetical protein
VHKKFENNLSLENKIVLSVKKVVEDLQSLEDRKNIPSSKETYGRRSGDPGAGNLKVLLVQTKIFTKS